MLLCSAAHLRGRLAVVILAPLVGSCPKSVSSWWCSHHEPPAAAAVPCSHLRQSQANSCVSSLLSHSAAWKQLRHWAGEKREQETGKGRNVTPPERTVPRWEWRHACPHETLGLCSCQRDALWRSLPRAESNANWPAAGLPENPDGDGRIVHGCDVLTKRCTAVLEKLANVSGQDVGDDHAKVTFAKTGSFARKGVEVCPWYDPLWPAGHQPRIWGKSGTLTSEPEENEWWRINSNNVAPVGCQFRPLSTHLNV